MGDCGTVAAEDDLAVMEVFVLFQRMSEDEKEAETARAEPSLSVGYCATGLSTHQRIWFIKLRSH